MALDFDNIKFVINRIEYDGAKNDIKNYVMNPTPDLHCGCPVLIDEDGNEYPVMCSSRRTVSDDKEPKMVEYWFEFDDENDPDFPLGKTFTKKKAAWKKDIPDCKLESIEYESHGIVFGTSETFEKINVTIKANGEVFVTRGKSKYLSKERTAKFTVSEVEAQDLLNNMLACISRSDSYDNMYCDDTARRIVYNFENGHSLSFSGVYAYDDETGYHATAEIMEAFKEKCTTNVYRMPYTGKSIKEQFETIGADIGESVESIAKKTSDVGKRIQNSIPQFKRREKKRGTNYEI